MADQEEEVQYEEGAEEVYGDEEGAEYQEEEEQAEGADAGGEVCVLTCGTCASQMTPERGRSMHLVTSPSLFLDAYK